MIPYLKNRCSLITIATRCLLLSLLGLLAAIVPTLANSLQTADLVDLHRLRPQIVLDMRYATTNNFTGKKLYSQPRCLLRAAIAQKLIKIQTGLEDQGLGLKVFDCYRPLSVQKKMWQVVPDDRYVANPTQGSRHNRGTTVDLTLVDSQGRELEMPTPFDEFSDRSHIDNPDLSPTARRNLQRLQSAMKKHGFSPLITEWWHFDAKEWKQYPILDVSLDAVP